MLNWGPMLKAKDVENSKKCTKCGVEKDLADFGKNKSAKSGLRSYCKRCAYDMRNDWSHRNDLKVKEYYTRYRPKQILKYNERQLEKQKQNKCLLCSESLIGRQLLSRYCHSCKKQIRRTLKKISYKRCIKTSNDYNIKFKSRIRHWQKTREQNHRDNLTDRYITKLLVEKHGFDLGFVKPNHELIESWRLIIKNLRLCKTSQN